MTLTPAGAGLGMARPGVRHPYVAIEGADGAGKTTAARRLRLALEARGLPCFSPGQHSWLDPEATRIISRARGRHCEIRPAEVDSAYRRDFALLQRHCIEPALRHGTVVQDRSYLSTVVYGAALYGVPPERAVDHYQSTASVLPDLILFMDVSVDEALERIASRTKRPTVWEQREHIEEVISHYLDLLRSARVVPETLVHHNRTSPTWLERVDAEILPRVVALVEGATTTRPGT